MDIVIDSIDKNGKYIASGGKNNSNSAQAYLADWWKSHIKNGEWGGDWKTKVEYWHFQIG